jgi:FlaA1/EpsC-like NDP-sugar epimerase
MFNLPIFLPLKKILRIISWLIADIIFVNMAFYSAYLIRFKGIIETPAFIPYLHLWPHISSAHLIIFSIFKLYEPPNKFSKKQTLINTFNASTISILASMSIVYTMRHFWGFIPSLVFVFAWGFNILLVSGWRVFIRYES